MRTILLVFGTRPEAIKMAPLVKKLQSLPEQFKTVVAVTGQHRQMLDQVLHIFDIVPDYDLNIMQANQDLYDVTSRVLVGMRDVLKSVKPDVVLVHGDTTTSTAAALAAFYQQIPVGHVEAGLRTGNIYSPWPEEMNRLMTGRIATYHFAPTPLAKSNLMRENVSEERILVTGNTVIDALYMVVDKIKNDAALQSQLRGVLKEAGYDTTRLDGSRRLVLITGHRRENFGDGFISMCTAIRDLAAKYPEVDFVYPMHLNPNVRKPIQQIFGNITKKDIKENTESNLACSNASSLDLMSAQEQALGQPSAQSCTDTQSDSLQKNVSLPKTDENGHADGIGINNNLFFIEPLEYLSFVYLMEQSTIVLTDSGGIQEEAPGLGKPVLVMRDTTERPEALESGTVHLVGTNYDKIVNEVSTLLDDAEAYRKMSQAVNPYGDGLACGRIAEFLAK